MAISKAEYDYLVWADNYQRKHGRGPSNVEAAAEFRCCTKTIERRRTSLRGSGSLKTTREYASSGRRRIEVASTLEICWATAKRLYGTYADAIRQVRSKVRAQLSRLARLRADILSDQSIPYSETSKKAALPQVASAYAYTPRRAGSIWDQTNQRFDQRFTGDLLSQPSRRQRQ